MSRIHINIELDSNEPAFSAVLAALGQTAATTNVANTTVVDAEEVRAFSGKTGKMELVEPEAPAKTPTPRASRAKAKPEPTPEPEEEETETEPETAEIDADDIRAVQATKVDKHREAIKAKLKELGATGISNLDSTHFAEYYEFLSKLK